MSDSYTEMFRRLAAFGGNLPINAQIDRLVRLIPSERGTPVASPTPARMASTEIGAATPTVPLQPRQIYSEPVGPTRPPTITPGTASTPAPRMPTPPQPTGESEGEGQQSLLDMLRNRTAKKFNNENLESLSDIGAGMLASESPNFFTMLGAGLKNARERETERARELREVAADERRAMMDKAKFAEETSPESLTGRLREAQIRAQLAQAAASGAMANRPTLVQVGFNRETMSPVFVDPRNPSQPISLPAGTVSIQGSRYNSAAENTLRQTASREANRIYQEELRSRTARGLQLSQDEARQLRDRITREQLSRFNLEPIPGSEEFAPTAPTQNTQPPIRMPYPPPTR